MSATATATATASRKSTTAITPELKREFDDRGFIILRQAIDPSVIAGVRAEMEALVDDMARGLRAMDHIVGLYESEPFERRLIKLFGFSAALSPSGLRRNLHLKGMYGLFFCPPVLDMVEQLLGPEIRLYPNYTVRPKLPDDAKTLVLWHQDARYTNDYPGASNDPQAVSQLRMVNCWTGLVPARRENGCMQFIPGTHKLGIVEHDRREYYLEIVATQIEPRMNEAVDVTTDPGDVVLFSNMLFHRGLPNRTASVRWSCDWRYQDATQSTLRPEKGHLARSNTNPDRVVRSAEQWASLRFE